MNSRNLAVATASSNEKVMRKKKHVFKLCASITNMPFKNLFQMKFKKTGLIKEKCRSNQKAGKEDNKYNFFKAQ